ncbi:hypothetical protein UFOVP112_10 [uncultured Caudovirales phage]|uniref:Uncharacterized protein n=1 Tax=uncultured Caudovirales phage TaxID=2100421 RepID=A0A6J5L8Q9_9CAUD|nr:hypothetical protein UFOVP112_10 [uncultured Caudovirales phage]
MNHPFLKEAELSTEYVSRTFPPANYTAPWQPVNKQITNWMLPHRETVTYNFNELGYRGTWTESDLPNSIWCFGDSQTAGMGLHEVDLWSTLLEKQLNKRTINLGIGGASNDTIARTLVSATAQYRPSAICVLLSGPNRREIICDNGKSTFFPQAIEFIDSIDKNLFKHYVDSVDDTSNRVNYDKNLLLIQSRCRAMSIPLIVLDFTVHVWNIAQDDCALDGMHVGPKTHYAIADFYQSRLQTL